MDPWLEHPAIWPDVHNSLITAIRDELVPRVAPRYYVGLEQRVYALEPGELILVGRPDIVMARPGAVDLPLEPAEQEDSTSLGVLDVKVPDNDRLQEWYLEIHDVETGTLVTTLEILSPTNKIHAEGREEYIAKRKRILRSMTNLVEIDLLRAGQPMPLERKPPRVDYRILVRRGSQHPRAKLFTFSVRQAIPVIPIPLLPEDEEPILDLGAVVHALYDRARFDLRLNYAKAPVPSLNEANAQWARSVVESMRSN
jgi:hypothetical protein